MNCFATLQLKETTPSKVVDRKILKLNLCVAFVSRLIVPSNTGSRLVD